MRPEGETPSSEVLSSLAKAFGLMAYDTGMLASGEAAVFAKENLTPDKNRLSAQEASFTIVKSSAGDKVGFIRFPPLRKGDDMPSDDLIEKINQIIKSKRKQVRLLVALSDWGWVGEREYLARNPDFTPDFLFGSGRGSGVNGRIEADGRCVWVRPYDKGRTISEVQIYKWPERSREFVWKEPDNVKVLSIGLGDQYQDNPDVNAILQ